MLVPFLVIWSQDKRWGMLFLQRMTLKFVLIICATIKALSLSLIIIYIIINLT